MLIAAIIVAFSANAQYTNFAGHSRFFDNWSLGVEGGVQTNLHDWNNPQGGVFGLRLDKDLTPTFGLSGELLGGANNTGNWLNGHHFHNGTAIDNLTAYVTGRWNILNSLGGFKGYRRVFEVETNVGVGFGGFFANHNYASRWTGWLFKSGLNFNFNLGKERAWALSLRPAVVWNTSATGKFNSRHAVGELLASVTYHFKTSNGSHYFVKDSHNELIAEIEELEAANAYLTEQLALKPAEVKVLETVVEQVTTTDYVDNTYVVNFAWNSAELVDAAKETLNQIPEGTEVALAAYASPEGTAEYNLELSARRAQSVADYLATRNVKVVKTDAYGAQNQESNRIVIVTIQ